MRTTPALVFGLAALPGAWWLWHAPPSEPVAAAVLVLVAAAIAAWVEAPTTPLVGGMEGVAIALLASMAARLTLFFFFTELTTYELDNWPERSEALSIAAGVTLALCVAAGVVLGIVAQRRAYENQPDTTRTS